MDLYLLTLMASHKTETWLLIEILNYLISDINFLGIISTCQIVAT